MDFFGFEPEPSLPVRPRTSGLTDLSRGGKWIGLVDSRLSALQRILVT